MAADGIQEFTPPRDPSKEPIPPNLRQQDKIIKILDTGDTGFIEVRDHIETSEDERDRVLRGISTGKFNEDYFKRFLINNIRPPLQNEADPRNPSILFSKIAPHQQQRTILAEFTGKGIDQRDLVDSGDLGRFLELYPDPITFDSALAGYLDRIEATDGPGKRADTAQHLKSFKNTLYGKRQQYWEQIQLLIEEANSLPPEEKSVGNVLEGTTQTNPLSNVDELEGKNIMDRTEIHGERYKDQLLTTEILKNEGLTPRYKVNIDDHNIYFSEPYEKGKRLAVVGYVATGDNQVVARTYYLSNSHGLWKYLPDYSTGKALYGKGYDQNSISLPPEAQQLLASITKDNRSIKVGNPDLVFYGTARPLFSEGTYRNEVEMDPQLMEGNFYPYEHGIPVPPEQVNFHNPQQAPNFKEKLLTWHQTSPLYGDITLEAYPSNDSKYKYIFCRNSEGKAWIGAIENDTPLGSTGVRTTWVSGGDLLMPLFEHRREAGEYGDSDRLDRDGHYIEMWKNYLSKVPVIQRYLQSIVD